MTDDKKSKPRLIPITVHKTYIEPGEKPDWSEFEFVTAPDVNVIVDPNCFDEEPPKSADRE